MKNLFLVCLMMLAGSAWAEWVYFDEADRSSFYYDPATIRKDGHIRRVWELQDLWSRAEDGDFSRRYRMEYDCKQERARLLALSTHSEPMAGGKVLLNGGEHNKWSAIPPGTVSDTIFKIICAK